MQPAPGVLPVRGTRNVIDGGWDINEYIGPKNRRIAQCVDTGQAGAISERPATDESDAGGDRHGRQITAIRERPVTDKSDAGGDRHGRQITAISEYPIRDESNA